jgi:hypothetical protein
MKPSPTGAIEWIALVSYHDLLRFLTAQVDPTQALKLSMQEVINFACSPPLQGSINWLYYAFLTCI